MSPFLFVRAILAGEPLKVFNHGEMQRDFTYIDDVVEGVVRVMERPAAPGAVTPATSAAPWRIYNIGNNQPVALLRWIETFEQCLGRKARLELLPLQPGDVIATAADISALERDVSFRPTTSIAEGVRRFVDWYRDYYGV
jgi:UDP-glucuronate 4-epimerase